MNATDKPWTLAQTIDALRYIASSPPPPHGFHPHTVEIARNALRHIERLRKKK